MQLPAIWKVFNQPLCWVLLSCSKAGPSFRLSPEMLDLDKFHSATCRMRFIPSFLRRFSGRGLPPLGERKPTATDWILIPALLKWIGARTIIAITGCWVGSDWCIYILPGQGKHKLCFPQPCRAGHCSLTQQHRSPVPPPHLPCTEEKSSFGAQNSISQCVHQ